MADWRYDEYAGQWVSPSGAYSPVYGYDPGAENPYSNYPGTNPANNQPTESEDGDNSSGGFDIDPSSLRGWNYGGVGDWYSEWFKNFWNNKDTQAFVGTMNQDRPWQGGVDSWMTNWMNAQKPMEQYYQPALERMNQRGVLNSSITGDALADVTEERNRAYNQEMNTAETQQSQNWSRRMTALQALMDAAKYQQGENNSGWATLLASIFGGG
jgi:hypothetical protein